MQAKIQNGIQNITHKNNRLVIQMDGFEAHIAIYTPTIIRVNLTKTPSKADHSFAVIQQPETEINYYDTGEKVEVTTTALKLVINKAPLRFSFYTLNGEALSEDDARFGTLWQGEKVSTYRKLYPDEKFIGLGEKTGNLNRRGTFYTNWNTDASLYDTKTDPLYKTFPFFIGLHGGLTYGLFFDNTHKSYFNFGASTDEQMSWFGADGGDMNYYFFGSQTVACILNDYTWLTGRMEMPPLWSLGYQQCRWSYMSAKEVLQVAGKFRERQIPADVIYCDIDYMDGYKIFTWDPKTFPKPAKMIDKLKAMGFELVTIVDPGIKVEEGYSQYDEGVEMGYFATYPNGEKYVAEVWPGRCHFPDFFREDVKEWWGKSFKALIEPGVAGFWNDMNEPAVWGQNTPDIVSFGEHPMPAVRNAYGTEMARATYEGTKKLLENKRPFVLTRAAYSGVQRYSALWTGDNSATDAHMLLGQRLVNSIGLAGVALTAVDIGGFTGDPTPELMVRWNSLGVYTPMFRNHAAIDTEKREPWIWGAKNEAMIKNDIEQRYRLLPYIYSGFYQSHQTGMPLSRTLAIGYTTDENVYDLKYHNQFLFGDALLVTPVISTSMKTDVYLPKGEWYRLSSGKKYIGGQVIKAKAPLDDLPVFVKGSAIIPMQSVIQNTKEKSDGILELHIWNGSEMNVFTYYEDDGVTYDYQKGVYYKRTITFNPVQKQLTLSEVEGTFVSKYDSLKIIFHGFDTSFKKVDVNGEVLKAGKGGEDVSVFFKNLTEKIMVIY